MIRIPGRIPVMIYPAFWIFAGLIAFLSSGGSFLGAAIWLLVILVSVLFHEFGHALTALFFGRNPRIELVALGGITYHDGDKLPLWKQFFIVLNGPLFGFILFFLALLLNAFLQLPEGILKYALRLTIMVNLFWTLVNLLPVLPLDGGQLLRILCEKIFGVRGLSHALLGSLIVALAISLLSFLYQAFLLGALFFLFAFQSYDTWRRTRRMAEPDQREDVKGLLERAEGELSAGHKEEAAKILEQILAEVKEGMTYLTATQYLAYLRYEEGKAGETYRLLIPLRKELSEDALYLLQRAAYDNKDYSLASELAGKCYQLFPSLDAALRNAHTCAQLGQAEAAIGWLETALSEGLQEIKKKLANTLFDPIREDPLFRQFLSDHLSK